MQCTASWTRKQTERWLGSRLHALVLASVILAALLGQLPESGPGWIACPPQSIEQRNVQGRRIPAGLGPGQGVSIQAGWEQMRYTWIRALARSELLAVLWMVSDDRLPGGVLLVPWVEWFVGGVSVAWPWLGQQPEVRLLRWGLGWLRWGGMLLLAGEVVWQGLEQVSASSWGKRLWAEPMQRRVAGDWPGNGISGMGLMAGCVVQGQEKQAIEVSLPHVEVKKVEGGYQIGLEGEFYLKVKAEDTFWLRMVILFLRQVEGPVERRGGRATRDGRRPLVPQQQLAAWFEVPQPNISRWERYWQDRNWALLLSLRNCEVLTVELRDRIVDVFARFPWKGQQWVWEHLQQQGVVVSQSQVRQAAEDSGWARLKSTLRRFFVLNSASCCLWCRLC